MRKELNSKSKRKWIAGGLAAFASVALLTTGLATYIVGVQNTKVDMDGVKVNVDTAKNATLELVAALQSDSTIILAETEVPEANETNFFRVETTGDGQLVTTGNLGITFSTLEIRFGTDSGFDKNNYELVFSISKVNGTEGNVTQTYTTETDLFGRNGTLTYLEAPEKIDLATASVSESASGTVKTISLDNKNLSFRWGTVFDGKSPATYYNEKFTATPSLKTTANADKCVAEINAMHDAFTVDDGGSRVPGSIVLTVNLNQKAA